MDEIVKNSAPVDDWLQAILDAAIDEMAEPTEKLAVILARVKTSQDNLTRHNMPRDIEPEFDDTSAPTPERASSGETLEPQRDKSWFVVSTIERMHRQGQIGNAELSAAKTFYRDFQIGNSQGGLVSKYGERSGGGGTPPGQQATRWHTGKDGKSVEAMGPDDRRTNSHQRWHNACRAIGFVKCKVTGKDEPGFALYWMQKIVCEDYILANEAAPTLADVGRAYIGAKSQSQAQAAGVTVIKMGLERLADFYGY